MQRRYRERRRACEREGLDALRKLAVGAWDEAKRDGSALGVVIKHLSPLTKVLRWHDRRDALEAPSRRAVALPILLLAACGDHVPVVAPSEPELPPPPPPVYPIRFEWDDEDMRAAWGDMADSVAKAWGEALGYTPTDNPPERYWGRQDLPPGTTIRIADSGGLWGIGSGWGTIEGGPDRYGIVSIGSAPGCENWPAYDGQYKNCYGYTVFLHEVGHVFQSAWPGRGWCKEPWGWADEVGVCTAGNTVALTTAPKAVARFKAAMERGGIEWPPGPDGIPYGDPVGPHTFPECSGYDVLYSYLRIGVPTITIPYITPMLLDMLGPNYRPNYERASWYGKDEGTEYQLSVLPRCADEMKPRPTIMQGSRIKDEHGESDR